MLVKMHMAVVLRRTRASRVFFYAENKKKKKNRTRILLAIIKKPKTKQNKAKPQSKNVTSSWSRTGRELKMYDFISLIIIEYLKYRSKCVCACVSSQIYSTIIFISDEQIPVGIKFWRSSLWNSGVPTAGVTKAIASGRQFFLRRSCK